jgi:hypothetical protein
MAAVGGTPDARWTRRRPPLLTQCSHVGGLRGAQTIDRGRCQRHRQVAEIELRLILVREPDVRNDRVGGKPLLRAGSGRQHDAEARTGTAAFWKADARPRLRQLTPICYRCSVQYGITV